MPRRAHPRGVVAAACALGLAAAAPAALADDALFTFPLSAGVSNVNPAYTVNGITLTCSTDSTATPFDPVGNPDGVVQAMGSYTQDAADGAFRGALRMSENGTGRAWASGWLTFSTDVYQLDFYAWNLSGVSTPFTFEAYDARGQFVASTHTSQVATLPNPAWEHLSITGDAPIRALRMYGAVNGTCMDNLRVWTLGVTPTARRSWGGLKARYR